MRRIGWTVLAAMATMSFGASRTAAQRPASRPAPITTIVFGSVRNASGVAIPGADVWLDGTPARVVSNDSGEYRIDNAPIGPQRLMVRHVGFRPATRRLSLSRGETREVKFALEGLLEELEQVLVTARSGANGSMAGFWARRMVGVGVFITREEIDRRHPPQTSDLFNSVMGIHVLAGSGSEPVRLVTGRQSMSPVRSSSSAGSNGCPLQYYVDGMFMSPGTFNVDEIVPVQIEGIEIFRGPSEIPARFRQRETGCGLVVIWTRQPPAKTKDEKPDGARPPTDAGRPAAPVDPSATVGLP